MNIPYPIVPFRQKINGVTIRRKGYQIGDSLLVALYNDDDQNPTFCIYNAWTLTKVIPNRFIDFGECVRVAELLRDVYKDYWCINEVWPELDVFRAAQWSVDGGVQLYLALSGLSDRDTIRLSEVQAAWHANKDKAADLVRRYVHIT